MEAGLLAWQTEKNIFAGKQTKPLWQEFLRVSSQQALPTLVIC